MQAQRGKWLFWLLLAVQAAGSQAILWHGLPVYRKLLTAGSGGASGRDFLMASLVVLIMQVAHWVGFRIRDRIRFGRHPVFGHVLVWVGELSLFFVTALAVVAVFERAGEIHFGPWRLALLGAIIFAVTCYKHMLTSTAEALIAGERSPND